MSKKIIMATLLCLAVSACVPSLHPLYTDNDIVFEPALVGTWTEGNGEEVWQFTSDDSTSYTMTYMRQDTAGHFTAHLVRLGGQLFMDIVPLEPDIANEFYRFYLIRAHSFYKVGLGNDELSLDGLDMRWIRNKIDHKEIEIAHELLEDGNLILTAPTIEIQKLVTEYAADEEAFPAGGGLHRQK